MDERYLATADGGMMLDITVSADADLGGRFEAWDNDVDEMIMVNGWLFDFEAL